MFSFILSRFSTVGKRFTSLRREKEVNCLQNGASVGGYLTSAAFSLGPIAVYCKGVSFLGEGRGRRRRV